MENIITEIKNILLLALISLVSMITDIQSAFTILFAGFIINLFIGIGADVGINKKDFQMRKATEGMKLLLFYIVIVFFLYAVTYENKEVAKASVNALTYIVSYFYMTNIFRNAKIIFPKARSVRFIYNFLSTEVFFKLKEKLGITSDEEDQTTEENTKK